MKNLLRETLYDYLRFTEDGDPIKDMGIGIDTLINNWMKAHEISQDKYIITKDKKIVGINTIVLSNQKIDEIPDFIKFTHIHGGFHCDHNNLEKLYGPKIVEGMFLCSDNKLTNLIDGPETIHGTYAAFKNELTSLEGIAQEIMGDIYLDDNKLITLEYLPDVLEGNLYISNNPIDTLDYFSSLIKGSVIYTSSSIVNEKQLRMRCKILGKVIEEE